MATSALAVHHWVTLCPTPCWVTVCYGWTIKCPSKGRTEGAKWPSETSQDKCDTRWSLGLHRQGLAGQDHTKHPIWDTTNFLTKYNMMHIKSMFEDETQDNKRWRRRQVPNRSRQTTANKHGCAPCTEKLSETERMTSDSDPRTIIICLTE